MAMSALRHLQEENERLRKYAEQCRADLAQLGARDGELQEEVADLGRGLREMRAALGRAVAESEQSERDLLRAREKVSRLETVERKFDGMEKSLLQEVEKNTRVGQDLAAVRERAQRADRELEAVSSAREHFEGEWRRVSRELTAEQEARRRLEECADLRERDVQSSLGERDAKIKMLEAQVALLAECQEQLGVTREKLSGEHGEKLAMAERLNEAELAIKKLMALNQEVLGMAMQANQTFLEGGGVPNNKSSSGVGPVSLLPRGMVGYVPQEPLKHLAKSLEDELKELDTQYGEALGAVGELQRPEAELGVLLESITRKGEQLKHVRQCLRN